MKEILDVMESDLANHQFLAGDNYTLADVMGTCLCARVHMIKGLNLFGPNTIAYYQRMKARPSFVSAKCVEEFS